MLGAGALPPPPVASLGAVIPLGLIVHFILAAIYGVVFGAVVSFLGPLRSSRGVLVVAASIYGFLLWILNFYVIAPVLFPWFTQANPLVQFIAHTFFFGTALGLVLAGSLRKTED